MTEAELAEIMAQFQADIDAIQQRQLSQIEYRLYYDDLGCVVTYTTERLPGQYLKISREQYAEARADIAVRDGQIIETHRVNTAHRLTVHPTQGQCTSVYDVNILCQPQDPETVFYLSVLHEFPRTAD